VSNIEPPGIPKDHVKIFLREIAKANWGIRDGQDS
jgi:phenylpyruvate tautomerase PptA (4-oxalocrotonate tautomerase family)